MSVALASPLKLGDLALKNRFVLSPLTRDRGVVPNELTAEYYGHPWARNGRNALGIFNEKQVAGWKKVTDEVHAKGSVIFAQLWHIGRCAHPGLQAGQPIVGPSASGKFRQLAGGPGYGTPKAIEDPQHYVDMFRVAAQIAKRAGFDGVKIQSAGGYLLDQFIDTGSNKRTDKWGGSHENRARFSLEMVKAAIGVFGDSSRIGIKLSPQGGVNDVGDQEEVAIPTYTYLITELEKLKIGYILLRRWLAFHPPMVRGFPFDVVKYFRPMTKNAKLFVNGDLTGAEAAELVASGQIDAAVFGRPFIANPDLPHHPLGSFLFRTSSVDQPEIQVVEFEEREDFHELLMHSVS
ncbi:hypothetical protein BDK51DRAFT_36321 [Blyttiomyces helicus]|uniref:NADH:flavin oxidoreductase/NADH oxidase N-terminal domain-containing protein n=1 Tax=Blyttiomyces helicus TaxID=388810 RepID=A0A4P9WFD4_9FUNG|nr:hypothetical protein BDK51DRAFT_36321 [Blyttiomyces helicus]|eukprot:RKO90555.1 hypothetical protein BDK51DRAFT_36321 [Blyttiomyces helicus]